MSESLECYSSSVLSKFFIAKVVPLLRKIFLNKELESFSFIILDDFYS